MKPIRLTKTVQAPPEAVFAAFADFPNAAETVSGITRIEMLTDGPVGPGTKFRETRVMFKREATEEMEVTRYEPGKGYTLECESCGAWFASEFKFSPEGSGTRVELEMRSRPLTFMAKLMSPIGALMSGTMKKCVEQDIEDVREVVEARARGGEAGATA